MKYINKEKIIKIVFYITLLIISYAFISNQSILDIVSNNVKDNFSENILKVNNKTINKLTKINEKVSSNKEDYLVYIYNTHQTEKYFMPYTNDYSVIPTVETASSIFKDHLNDLNINSYVETRSITKYLNSNKLNYSDSYTASKYYLNDIKSKYDIKYYIDIHRDSLSRKYTLFTKDNKKYAKIMFVVGTKHDNYKENLDVVNNLIKIMNKDYKGLCKSVYKRTDTKFNQDISKYSILVEVGGVDNTIDEINNSLYVLAQAIYQYEETYGK